MKIQDKDCDFFADLFVKCLQTQEPRLKIKCDEIRNLLGNSILDTYLQCKKDKHTVN